MSRLDSTIQADSKPTPGKSTGRPSVPRSSKILGLHLVRLAIVYVRQSDPQQVLNHRESRERQYELVELAVALGWPRDHIVIIDDDQGKTARTALKRSGFHRILAEVTMEHVGLILGIEMSRIARNNRDWHNLLVILASKLGRAVYVMLRRGVPFDEEEFLKQ
jgi:DNA invertase Pin-like site-specific DNA recombinase